MNIDFNKNEDSMKLLISKLNEKLDKAREGGGKKNADKQRALGKQIGRAHV